MGKMKELEMDGVVESQKINYFNDTKNSVSVFVNGLGEDHFVQSLKPAELGSFVIDIPNGCVPFIKAWDGYVMISYMPDRE